MTKIAKYDIFGSTFKVFREFYEIKAQSELVIANNSLVKFPLIFFLFWYRQEGNLEPKPKFTSSYEKNMYHFEVDISVVSSIHLNSIFSYTIPISCNYNFKFVLSSKWNKMHGEMLLGYSSLSLTFWLPN